MRNTVSNTFAERTMSTPRGHKSKLRVLYSNRLHIGC